MSYRPTVNQSVAGAFVGQRTQVNTMADAFENIFPPGISVLAQGLVGITHVVSCPVASEGRGLGVIRFLVPAPPTGEQQALMEAAASQIALVIANARLAQQARRHLAASKAIAEITRLGIVEGPTAMLQSVADRARDLTRADDAVIYLIQDQLIVAAAESVSDEGRARGQGRMPVPPRNLGEGLVGWVIASDEPAFVQDPRRDPRVRSTRQIAGIEAIIAVPMRSGRDVFGCVRLGVVGRRRFTEDDLWLTKAFGDEAAAAVVIAREHEQALAAAYAAGVQHAIAGLRCAARDAGGDTADPRLPTQHATDCPEPV
jgi:GAF domain-containing protein